MVVYGRQVNCLAVYGNIVATKVAAETFRQFVLWTGRLAAILIVLNFTTCFVMPWARNKLPFRGSKPGADEKDQFGNFQFMAVHKIFAWSAIVAVALHIILSIAQGSIYH
jgi:cytochrome b561